MVTIAVTGANGKAGRAVVAELLEHGYHVLATDLTGGLQGADHPGVEVSRADLTEFGEAIEALADAEAVVHMANIPAPGLFSGPETLTRNTAMNYNVFLAAQRLGLAKVVWASSETTLGLPFDTPPRYAPVDEAHFPVPETTYALSKILSEAAAEQVSRWSGIPFVGLRLSNIFRPAPHHDYEAVSSFWSDPRSRKWNLWGYIDARDVALAARLALETETTGAHNVIIAAADTIMDRPSADLMAEVYPDVPLAHDLSGFETLLAIDGARELLGFEPQWSWRDELGRR